MLKRLLTTSVATGIIIAGLASSALAQANVLTNPSFTDPPIAADSCTPRDQSAPSDWTTSGMKRKGSVFIPPCPHGDPADYIYASMDHSGGMGGFGWARQIVNIPTANGTDTYAFSGEYVLGANDSVTGVTGQFQIYGPDWIADEESLPVAEIGFTKKNGQTSWHKFRLTAVPPAGATQMMVQFQYQTSNGGFIAMHVDNVEFAKVTDCLVQPHIISATPATATSGTGDLVMTITGKGFTDVAGTETARLVGPATIDATSVVVNSSTQVTATFPMGTALAGRYELFYSQPGCTVDACLLEGLEVYLGSFTNGGFESPDVTDCTPPPGSGQSGPAPDNWYRGEANAWGYSGVLSFNNYFGGGQSPISPTCPLVDVVRGEPTSGQYGTMYTTNDGGTANAYQTFAITQGTTYMLSGYFAGGGNERVYLGLHDGTLAGTLAAQKIIHEGPGNYDWYFDYVKVVPGASSMTIDWHVDALGSGNKTTSADSLVLAPCDTPITSVDSITPNLSGNTGVVQITNLAGAGFSGTPDVFLNKGGKQIKATAVTVVSSTKITCSFDLTGVPVGQYDVLIKQGGCYASSKYEFPSGGSAWSFGVVATEFVNGKFEDPTVALDCGQPIAPLGGQPTGWFSTPSMSRDGNAPAPPAHSCATDGHYGTMAATDTPLFKAWQTVLVVPGQPYKLSGQFAGGADCTIRLLDGFETGTEIASTSVFVGGDAGTWHEASVTGTAVSQAMTVVWEIANATNIAPGGHADNLTFGTDCHTPWADADSDGDVDMDDFAVWQRCYTGGGGSIPTDPPYCLCFDKAAPTGTIDSGDLALLLQCMSGPNVAWASCNP